MNFEDLIDYPIDYVNELRFDNNVFININTESLTYLDDYIISNLNKGLTNANKDYLLKVGKLIVNSIGFLNEITFENSKDFKIRWLAFSDLCERFLETKSGNIAHQEIIRTYEELKRYGYSPQIIEYIYSNKVVKVSDIEKLLGAKKQYASNLIKKFDALGVITKSTIGKNKLIRLTSIGIEIYKIYTQNKEFSTNSNEYSKAFKEDSELSKIIKSDQSKKYPPELCMSGCK